MTTKKRFFIEIDGCRTCSYDVIDLAMDHGYVPGMIRDCLVHLRRCGIPATIVEEDVPIADEGDAVPA